MYRATLKSGSPCSRAFAWSELGLCPIIHKLGGRAIIARHPQDLAIEPIDDPPVAMAQARCVFDQGFQDRRKIKGGAADQLKHFGSGCLLFERLGDLFIPCLELVE